MESIKELRELCRKTSAVKSPIIVRIMRFFSIYVTWFFLHFKKITPHYITIGGTIIFIIGAFCYIKGEYWTNLVGLSLIWLSVLLDYVDGEMGRYLEAPLKKTDPDRVRILVLKATTLESWTHDIKYGLLFIPIGIGQSFSFFYPNLLILLGFAASMSQVLNRLSKLRYIHSFFPLKLAEESYLKIGAKTVLSKQNPLRKILNGAFGATIEIAAWLTVATILNKVSWIVVFYGIFFTAIYLALVFKQYKAFKQL